jgi:hypothetical protein
MTDPMRVNAAETTSSISDEGSLVAELRSLKRQRSPRSARVARAMQLLEQPISSRVRNAAALALADLQAHSAKDKLIALLTRPETKGSRGSVLFALDELGADVPLPILAQIILDDSYEAREEALTLIVRNRVECSAEEFAHAKAALEAANASADADSSHAIQRALKSLGVKHYHNVRR